MTTLYAIGHSTRSFDKFIEILRAHGITMLADVRMIPKSRRNPQFNREALAGELPKGKTVKTHKPNSVVWIVAFLLFLYVLIGFFAPLPYVYIVALVAAALLLLGTTVF